MLKLGGFDVGVETITLPNKLTKELPVVRCPGASAVVALDEDGTIAMTYQYRYAIGEYLWEVPAGDREPGESSKQCAERELWEEAGLVAARWDHLGSIVTVPSCCDERIDLFLARDLSVVKGAGDADEIIRVECVPMNKAFLMIRQGEIVDSKTIAALHSARSFIESHD